MSKLVTLSLRLVERLEEMGLITEEAEEFVEDVEENLVRFHRPAYEVYAKCSQTVQSEIPELKKPDVAAFRGFQA